MNMTNVKSSIPKANTPIKKPPPVSKIVAAKIRFFQDETRNPRKNSAKVQPLTRTQNTTV